MAETTQKKTPKKGGGEGGGASDAGPQKMKKKCAMGPMYQDR